MTQPVTGRALLISRLAVRDLRYRPVQAVLLLVVIATALREWTARTTASPPHPATPEAEVPKHWAERVGGAPQLTITGEK